MTGQRLVIECFTGHDGGFYWRMVHTNGEIAAVSEAYRRRTTRDRLAHRIAKLAGFSIIDVDAVIGRS